MSISNHQISIIFVCRGGGGGGGGVGGGGGGGGEGSILRYGWFWVHVHNVDHVRPKSKNGAKNQNLPDIEVNILKNVTGIANFRPKIGQLSL